MARLNWSKDRDRQRLRGATETATGELNAAALAQLPGRPAVRCGPSKAVLRAEGEAAAEKFFAIAIPVECPACKRTARLSPRHRGKRLRCSGCGHRFMMA